VVIPVLNVDRAKSFYGGLGWRLDADYASDDGYFRVIQFTPPGSGCSVIFGKNVTAATPGSAQGLYLIVSDIEAARSELIDRGVEISEVFHDANGDYAGTDEPFLFGRHRVSGLDPERRSYRSFASFRDPDGNGWLLQEITVRLPGRVDTDGTAACSRLRSAARQQRTASTRSGPANPTPTGQTGTPPTWWLNSPAKSCRNERLRRGRHRSGGTSRLSIRRSSRAHVRTDECKARARLVAEGVVSASIRRIQFLKEKHRRPLWAVKPILQSQENDGFGAESGPSRGDPCRRAIRPIDASKAAVGFVRNTSTPAVWSAQRAAVPRRRWDWASSAEHSRLRDSAIGVKRPSVSHKVLMCPEQHHKNKHCEPSRRTHGETITGDIIRESRKSTFKIKSASK